jgi:hypothetical protein
MFLYLVISIARPALEYARIACPFILSQFRPHNRNHLHDRAVTLCKANRAIRMGCITAARLIAARCDRTSGCSSAMGFINTFHKTEIF